MMEMAKGSSYHNLFLWVAGARLGRDVYVENNGFMVSPVRKYCRDKGQGLGVRKKGQTLSVML
jgi:hypothetical protein